MAKYGECLINGEPWVIGDAQMITHTCCDCELTHKVTVDVNSKKKTVTLCFHRDDYYTLKKRKKRGIKIVHKKKK